MGNYKKASDVDIAIIGKNITRRTVLGVSDLLNEEYPIPYFFDIIHYEIVTNNNLKEHIDSEGKRIYCNKEEEK